MASWNSPALVNKIADDVPAIKALLTALFKWTDADTDSTSIPVGAKRLFTSTGTGGAILGRRIEEYDGSSWASVGRLLHDCDTLDGKHAATGTSADTIPVRDASGKIDGDILGNAYTATTASGLASGYVVPVANGGTGADDAAQARINLGTNNAANITTGVLAIANGGTGSDTKNFVDLSSAQTIGGDKNFSGKVILNKNVLQMTVLDTTEGATDERTDTVLQAISSNSAYGINAMFGASGNAVVGAGEGKNSLLAELAGNTGEAVYIIADGNIIFHPNANTYANKKTITLNTSGELSGLAKVTSTNFTGALTGNCSGSSGSCTGNAATATKLATARTINIQDSSATNTGTGASFDGSGNATIKLPATIEASITGNCSGSSGSCTGNAATATKATQDSAGNNINTTYIKALSVSGRTITYTKGNGTTGTITTQDNNTTYSNFVKSGSSAAAGLVPKPSTTAGTSKYLREDCSWQTPPNTTYSAATTSAAGLMSAADKTKLNGIATGATVGCTWAQKAKVTVKSGNATKTTVSASGLTVGKLAVIWTNGAGVLTVKSGLTFLNGPLYLPTATSASLEFEGSASWSGSRYCWVYN